MYYFQRMSAFVILGLLISFSIGITSCSGLPPGDEAAKTKLDVEISNPEWKTSLGWSEAPSTESGLGFEVEVTINTLNSSNEAVFYSTKVVQFPRTSTVFDDRFLVNDVSIPSSGAYVVQYTLRSLNCTWPEAAPECYKPGFGYASKKYFKDQHTMATGGNPGLLSFACTILNRYTDVCC